MRLFRRLIVVAAISAAIILVVVALRRRVAAIAIQPGLAGPATAVPVEASGEKSQEHEPTPAVAAEV